MQNRNTFVVLSIGVIAITLGSCRDPDSPSKGASDEVSPVPSVEDSSSIVNETSSHSTNDDSSSIKEILRSPENLQQFSYTDFGPPPLTMGTLGKPSPFHGVEEKQEAGWPVGNIRVLVTAHSHKEPQLIFLKQAGVLEPKLDYRVLWYFDAVGLIDSVLENPELAENLKTRPREVRKQIVEKMGSADEIRRRISTLREPLRQYVEENKMYDEIRSVGEIIMEKGQSR